MSPLGNNSNIGSISAPLASIQSALNLCSPGDTVQVRGGNYFEKISWTNSGTANNFITLKNYNNEQAIIDGTGVTGIDIIFIFNKSYIIIKGIILQNNYGQDANGIFVKGEGSNVVIEKCIVKNIGWTTNAAADPYSVTPNGQAHGIILNGKTTLGYQNLTVKETKIFDIITGNSEALTVVGNVSGFTLDRDTVFNTTNIGIVAAGHYSWAVDSGVDIILNQSRNGIIKNCVVHDNKRFSNLYAPAGIYVDGGKDIKILNNTSYMNGNGISIGCETSGLETRNIFAMNNVVYENDNNGFVFGSNEGITKKCSVVNNTIFKNGTYQNFRLEIFLQKSDSSLVANNVAIPRTNSHYGIGIFGYITTNLIVTNNLIYRYNGDANNLYVTGNPSQFIPVNNVNADPQFINNNLNTLNLNIANTSPAINMGNNYNILPLEIDAGSNYRIVNGKLDIGAYERQDGGCPVIHTINDNQLLKGKFVASQKIIFNQTLTPLNTSALLWSSPIIEVGNNIIIAAPLVVNNIGCN